MQFSEELKSADTELLPQIGPTPRMIPIFFLVEHRTNCLFIVRKNARNIFQMLPPPPAREIPTFVPAPHYHFLDFLKIF